jgi:hypothetical protein
MLTAIKGIIMAHLAQSIMAAVVIVAGIGGASYIVFQNSNPSDNTKNSAGNSCKELVAIGTIAVEKDPAGDPEAWLRFDYTTSGGQALNCKYTISFYDSQQQAIRTIPDVEDTFESPNGQIHNGYSSTPYQAGMTARVTIQ